jgi:hypothetical protein
METAATIVTDVAYPFSPEKQLSRYSSCPYYLFSMEFYLLTSATSYIKHYFCFTAKQAQRSLKPSPFAH